MTSYVASVRENVAGQGLVLELGLPRNNNPPTRCNSFLLTLAQTGTECLLTIIRYSKSHQAQSSN